MLSLPMFEFFYDVGEVLELFFSYIIGISDRFEELLETIHAGALIVGTVFLPFGNSIPLLVTLLGVVVVLRIFGRY